MAKLSNFRSDTKAIQDGAWVRVNEALYHDLEILTRGYTDEFVDAQAHRLVRAAEPYNGDQAQIPNAVRREINGALLAEFLVLGVRNLLDDQDQPVEIETFRTMLGQQAYGRLARAAFEAAGKVTTRSSEQLRSAVGNFETASPGT